MEEHNETLPASHGPPERATQPGQRFVALVAGRAALAILALATTRVLTELLSPAEVGRVMLVFTITGLFALTLVNPFGMYVNRRLHEWQVAGVVPRRMAVYALFLLAVAVVAAISVAGAARLGWDVAGASVAWLVLLVSSSLLINTLHQTALPSLNLLGQTGWFLGLALATAALGLVVSAFLVQRFERSAEWWIVGLLATQFFVLLVAFPAFLLKARPTGPVTPLLRESPRVVAAFVLPLVVAVGLWWVQSQSYRFILERDAGLAALGLFAVGYGIAASILSLFEAVLTQFLQPAFYRDASRAAPVPQTLAWERYAGVLLPSLVLTVVFVVAFADPLARLLLGDAFRGAATFVIWGAVAEGGRVLASAYGLVAHASMRTRALLPANAAGAAVAVALAVLLVPRYGAHGAGAALAVAAAVNCAAMVAAMRTERPVRMPIAKLARSAVLGFPLVLVAFAGRWLAGTEEGLMASLSVVAVGGGAFAAGQWLLLFRWDARGLTT